MRDIDLFCRFRGLQPTICGLERISMPCDPCYMTIEASAKLVISAIFGCFRGLYNTRFVVPGGFRFTVTPRCTTIEASAKCVISTIFGRLRGLQPMICGLERISMPCDPRYTTIEASAKLVISAIFGRFRVL